MRHPCLIEKRRTSCAPPYGSPIRGWRAAPARSPGRLPSGDKRSIELLFETVLALHEFQKTCKRTLFCLNVWSLFRPIYILAIAQPDQDRRPRGRCTGCASFFDETGMSHRKIPASPQVVGLNWTWNVFLTRAYGARPSGRLRRSRRKRRSGYFLCAKESNSRTSAKKEPGLTRTPSSTDIHSATKLPDNIKPTA